MKKIVLKVLIGFVIMVILSIIAWVLLHPMSKSEQDKSIGINGGFEYSRNNTPINWMLYMQTTCPSGKFEINISTTEAHEGKQSLNFIVQECSNKGGRFSPGIAQEIEAEANHIYRIKFWLKNEGSKICLTAKAVDAKHQSNAVSLTISDTIKDWRAYELKCAIPQDMHRLSLELSVLQAGKVWVDDISVEQVTP